MELRDANRLLAPGYTELESGYRRLDDGQLHVAAWTTMFGWKGRMACHEEMGYLAGFRPGLYAHDEGLAGSIR